jgi:hypothetical protein
LQLRMRCSGRVCQAQHHQWVLLLPPAAKCAMDWAPCVPMSKSRRGRLGTLRMPMPMPIAQSLLPASAEPRQDGCHAAQLLSACQNPCTSLLGKTRPCIPILSFAERRQAGKDHGARKSSVRFDSYVMPCRISTATTKPHQPSTAYHFSFVLPFPTRPHRSYSATLAYISSTPLLPSTA